MKHINGSIRGMNNKGKKENLKVNVRGKEREKLFFDEVYFVVSLSMIEC